MSRKRPQNDASRYRWVVPVAVVVAILAILYAVVVSVSNGTFL
ncbi:hypothetical protein ACFSBZ_01095 [Amnibacterium flavum]|nr:hypothetical protein [Amnibacterium flavum]